MERCGFFDANLVGEEYDRVYLAQEFAAYFASFIGNGVFANKSDELQVLAMPTPAMQVTVKGGQGWINGYWYENTDDLYLPIDVADGVLNRIDIVVLRLGFSERAMWVEVKKGSTAVNPVAPDIVRNADYYELKLAEIYVGAGAIRITQANITDTRMDQAVCGWVTGLVEQLDTTTLFNQFEAYFTEFKERYEADYDNWTAEQKAAYIQWLADTKQDYNDYVSETEQDYDDWTGAKKDEYDGWYDTHIALWQTEFETWFDNVKGQLSTDVAGRLQNQLDEHEALLNSLAKMLIKNEITAPFETTNETLLKTTDNKVLLFTTKHQVYPCKC
ncbi:MAG: hypothetical protein KBT03_03325 [Bacteroidales bacterium]|nr:hypothetical protein [Candidatus Scybalousia scybalohippi]